MTTIATMKRIGLISLLGALSATILVACKKEEPKSSLPQPTVTARLQGGKLQVQFQVPSRHHAYLDEGREGNLIPISFDWQGWSEKDAPLKAVQLPPGEPDADSGARVLRGEGTFVFEPRHTPPQTDFRVRVQICEEVKGVCYRPTWIAVKPGT